MRASSTYAALLALPVLSLAASLADFTPRVSGLPTNCQMVYVSTIPGCTSSDFISGKCSASCIQGLLSMAPLVQATCSGLAFPGGQNVIAAFLAGQGPASLCPNLNAVLSSLMSTSSAAQAQTVTALPSSALQQSTSTSAAASSSGIVVLSSSASSSASSTGLPTLTLTESAAATTSASSTSSTSASTSAASTSKSSSSNNNNNNGGGGSPFDTQSSGADAAVSRTGSTLLMGVVVLAFAALR